MPNLNVYFKRDVYKALDEIADEKIMEGDKEATPNSVVQEIVYNSELVKRHLK